MKKYLKSFQVAAESPTPLTLLGTLIQVQVAAAAQPKRGRSSSRTKACFRGSFVTQTATTASALRTAGSGSRKRRRKSASCAYRAPRDLVTQAIHILHANFFFSFRHICDPGNFNILQLSARPSYSPVLLSFGTIIHSKISSGTKETKHKKEKVTKRKNKLTTTGHAMECKQCHT